MSDEKPRWFEPIDAVLYLVLLGLALPFYLWLIGDKGLLVWLFMVVIVLMIWLLQRWGLRQNWQNLHDYGPIITVRVPPELVERIKDQRKTEQELNDISHQCRHLIEQKLL